MASSQQLHKDWQQLVKQKTELSAEVDSLSKRRDFLKRESLRFEEERRQIEKELAQREANVKQREQHINIALARTEETIRKDIEGLNDEIIRKQKESKGLDQALVEKHLLVKRVGKTIQALDSESERLQRKEAQKIKQLEHLKKQSILEKGKMEGVAKHLAQAQAELHRVSEETRNLTKLKHDLDMYYMRIKNYYKKAGLHFVDEKYVGIPSN
jgi:chromosome segregation ATPase